MQKKRYERPKEQIIRRSSGNNNASSCDNDTNNKLSQSQLNQ